MLESGLELAPSLHEISEHAPKRSIQRLCASLAVAVEQGSPFATALASTKSFPPIVSRLAHIGEETGQLSLTLQRAATFIQKRRLARGNVISSLAYPLVVAMAACAVATYLVVWAIPKLAVFLRAMGRSLPTMTQSLLDVSDMIRSYGPQLAIVLAAAAVSAVLVYFWRPGRYRIDQGLLQLPIIGTLLKTAETQQLASSLALMLRSGVFLPDALATASMLHRNTFLADKVTELRKRITRGEDLASSLRGESAFASMLASMAAVGEQTGDLPRSMDHVADFYASQLDSSLNRMARMIEPTIIVFVGAIVGYVYIAFFMALLSAGGNFK